MVLKGFQGFWRVMKDFGGFRRVLEGFGLIFYAIAVTA